VKKSGIELSYYALLGLAGEKWRDERGEWNSWEEHADETSSLLNIVNPDFIRFRRLWVHNGCSLNNEIEKGNFIEQSPEGTILELRKLISGLQGITSEVLCDHRNNYIMIHGKMPKDKARMLRKIDEFLNLPGQEREKYYKADSII